MGYIYKVTNKINGKVYVGQTTRSIETRWKEHILKSRNTYHGQKTHFERAVAKYGKDAFAVEQLEECSNDVINEREQHWIAHFDSYRNGYNQTVGGKNYWVYDNQEILKAWNEGLSTTQISQKIGIYRDHVSPRLRAMGISSEEICKRGRSMISSKIYKYDLNGNFIEGYVSTREAKRQNAVNNLNTAIDNPERSAGGFMWRTYKRDHIEPYRDTHNRREVHQYSLDGTYIKTFRSVRAAAQAVGVNRESLRDALKRSAKKCSGYLWSYEKLEMVA